MNKLGKSSVEYEVGVFETGKDDVAAVGGYTHVFVDSKTRKTGEIKGDLKTGLDALCSQPIFKL